MQSAYLTAVCPDSLVKFSTRRRRFTSIASLRSDYREKLRCTRTRESRERPTILLEYLERICRAYVPAGVGRAR